MKAYKQFKYTCRHVLHGEYVFDELRKCNLFFKVLFWLVAIPLTIIGMIRILRE